MAPVVDVKGRSAIEAEAQAWIVQLDGRVPTKEDLAALRDWAARSPQHYATLRDLAQLWGEIDGLSIENLANAAEPAPRPAAVAAAPRWRAPLAAAAAVALLVCGGAAVWTVGALRAPEPQIYATAVGEQRTVALADGSELRLNTDSTVEVTYSGNSRDVRLVEGEALFEVAPDAGRPFTVFADRSAVRAVGTAFSVRLDRSEVDVLVTEGVVELFPLSDRREGEAPRLGAQQAAVLAGGRTAIRDVSPREFQRLMAWRDGMLVFQGEALQDVLEEVGRYTELEFRIADPSLSVLRVGGQFGVGEIDGLLNALETGMGLEVRREGDTAVIISAQAAN